MSASNRRLPVHPEDMKMFLSIIQMIKDGKLDKYNKMCFITGVLAGLNSENPDIYENLADLPEVCDRQEEAEEIEQMIQSVETFED